MVKQNTLIKLITYIITCKYYQTNNQKIFSLTFNFSPGNGYLPYWNVEVLSEEQHVYIKCPVNTTQCFSNSQTQHNVIATFKYNTML
jgi:hypothetical protein